MLAQAIHSFRAILVLLLVGTFLLGMHTPVDAKVHRASDARGDLLEVGTEQPTAAPDRADWDIIRTVFRHKTHRVRVRVTFAALRRNFLDAAVVIPLVTNEGVRRYALLTVDRESGAPWAGRADLYRWNDDFTRCRPHHTIDYQANQIVIGFSRKCLGQPRWVKLGVEAISGFFHGEVYRGFEDDALLDGQLTVNEAKLSRRIFRG